MAILILTQADTHFENELVEMHSIRKRVFVDLLKWDVPVVGGLFEMDQFDTPHAIYFIDIDDKTGTQRGSLRLLPSMRPHILGDLFPELCAGPVPRSETIYEVTRAVTNPAFRAGERLKVRNELTTALIEFGLLSGITDYTAVAEMGWYSQMLALGWDATPLGLPRLIEGQQTSAVQISVSVHSIEGLKRAGTYISCPLVQADQLPAAPIAA